MRRLRLSLTAGIAFAFAAVNITWLAPQPTVHMLALWQEMTPEQLGWGPLQVQKLDPARVNVLSVLGARYVVAEPGTPVPATPGHLLRAVYTGGDAVVMKNAAAVPRALVPARVRLASDERATRQRILEPDFDPRREVVVEAGQPGAAALAHAPSGRGSVTLVHDGNARVALRATLDRPDDQLLEGWSVTIDGRAAQPLRVDAVMRGVLVGAGSHAIVWRYAVPGLRLGALLSLLALAGLLTASGVLVVRRPRHAA